MTDAFYSNEEIRTLYRQAKNKKRQIGILADLNCCTKDEIRKIIFQDGTSMATSKDVAAEMIGAEMAGERMMADEISRSTR